MFRQHDVIHMSKKAKELHRKCQLHNEPFTMFCTTKKTMLCMKCFRLVGTGEQVLEPDSGTRAWTRGSTASTWTLPTTRGPRN
jgi:hypothetical protein